MTTWEPTELGSFHDLFDSEEDAPLYEDHRYPNYDLSWSKRIHTDRTTGQRFHIFCCCGGDKAVIVGVEEGNSNPLSWRKLSTVVDDDPNESFRACAFGGRSSTGATVGAEFLILGGKAAVIKLVDIDQQRVAHHLKGHDSIVNDLKVSPANQSLLLSASTDECIRLWNLDVRACVAVFAGRNGHRRSVLSVSWNIQGTGFASSGFDGCVRLWDVMGDEEVIEALHARKPMRGESIVRGRPHNAEFPYFRSNKLHISPADCVHWLSDELLVSKSTDNEILLWSPDFSKREGQRKEVKVMAYPPARDVTVFIKFQLPGLQSYFSRFSVDSLGEQLAVGQCGTVPIFNLDEEIDENDSLPDTGLEDDTWLETGPEPMQELRTGDEPKNIRATAFCPSTRILIACSDDGTLYIWGAPTGLQMDLPLGGDTESTANTTLDDESSYEESSDEDIGEEDL